MAIRSPLRYPGGKWKALPQILPLLKKEVVGSVIKDWREPFFGGGSVTLGYLQYCEVKPEVITVNDLAPEVYRFWVGCRDYPEEVAEIAKEMYQRFETGEELWKYLSTVDCETLTLQERAARFFLSNRVSFSGMGDSGSLSRDQYADFKLEHTSKILEVSQLLQGIDIQNKSFEDIVLMESKYKPEEVFIFLDPPYLTQEKSGLYGKGGDTHFGFPHELHRDVCIEADKRGYNWLITLDDCQRVRRLYNMFDIEAFKLTYTMAGKVSEDALQGEEVFISNYAFKNKHSELDEDTDDMI